MENSNFKESSQIIKASLKETVKKHKWLPAVCITVFVIAALLLALLGVLRSDSMTSKLVYSFIPEEVYIEELNQTFYSELNEDYNSSQTDGDYLDMFKTYSVYTDPATGEETKNYIDKTEVLYFGEDGNGQVDVNLVFLAKGAEKLGVIIKVIKYIVAVLIVGVIVLAIYLWYRSYTKREQLEREKRYKNKNKHRH